MTTAPPVAPSTGDQRAPPDAPDVSARRRPRRRIGTATRLAALQALVVAVVLAAAVGGLVRTFAAQAEAGTVRSLTAEARGFAASARSRPAGQDLLRFSEVYLRTHVLPDGETVMVALRGRPVIGSVGSGPLIATADVRELAASPPTRTVSRVETVDGRSTRVLAVPLRSGSSVVGTLVVAADRSRQLADTARVFRLTVGEAAVALLASVAGAFLLLRRLLRRVGRITATAASVGSGDLDRRLGDQGTDDEVGTLAATFDAMADRLAAAMGAQRRLLSDVSHQLRTPLTVARGHLEVLDRTGVDDPRAVRDTVHLVVDELDHMRTLVEQLLMLGRAMEPDFCEPQPIDLRSFVGDLTDAVRVLAPRHWIAAPVPDLVLSVDPVKLRGAVLNLVDNAVRATRAGDELRLSAAVRGDGGVDIVVEDSGPGIPPAQRAIALARFERPGAVDSTGSGLGMAIAKAVAEAHGGGVRIDDSPLGGARVTIALPPACVVADVPPQDGDG